MGQKFWAKWFSPNDELRTEKHKKAFRIIGTEPKGVRIQVLTGNGRKLLLTYPRLDVLMRNKQAIATGSNHAINDVWEKNGVGGDTTNESQYWAVVCEAERRRYRGRLESEAKALDPEVAAMEGNTLLVTHLARERSPAIVAQKKAAARHAHGRLECEACGLVPSEKYLKLSDDICEVHHLRPLSTLKEAQPTRLEDLAILCPNCHRAIHRTHPFLDVKAFRALNFSNRA